MQEYMRWTDQFPTVSLKLNFPAPVSNQVWRGWVPVNNLFFDGRPGKPVDIGFILAMQSLTESYNSGIAVGLMANNLTDTIPTVFSPRKFIVTGIPLQVFVNSGQEVSDLLVTCYCIGRATDNTASRASLLPTPLTNSTDWVVNDLSGGVIDSYWEQIA